MTHIRRNSYDVPLMYFMLVVTMVAILYLFFVEATNPEPGKNPNQTSHEQINQD